MLSSVIFSSFEILLLTLKRRGWLYLFMCIGVHISPVILNSMPIAGVPDEEDG
jgi:hypothetical protein